MKFHRTNSMDTSSPGLWRPNIRIESDWARNCGYNWWALEEKGREDTFEEAERACEMAVWRQYSGPREEKKEK